MNGVPMTTVPEAVTPKQRKRIKDRFPHAITMPDSMRRVARQELTNWCVDELGQHKGRWYHQMGSDIYRFVSVADATLFKLRWC